MTETAQGDATNVAKAPRQIETESVPNTRVNHGINPDMPSSPLEAAGKGKDWGERYCT